MAITSWLRDLHLDREEVTELANLAGEAATEAYVDYAFGKATQRHVIAAKLWSILGAYETSRAQRELALACKAEGAAPLFETAA